MGLLKAAGTTPTLVAATFLTENVALALFAAVVRIVVGGLIAPLLTSPGAALIGTPGAPAFGATGAMEVLGVALVATLVPAIRAARTSTAPDRNYSSVRSKLQTVRTAEMRSFGHTQ